MSKYNPESFIDSIKNKTNNKLLRCPFCQGTQFTTTEDFATILIGNDFSSITLGSSIPSGMIICQNCGHIDFFALGILNLLNNSKEEGDGKPEHN